MSNKLNFILLCRKLTNKFTQSCAKIKFLIFNWFKPFKIEFLKTVFFINLMQKHTHTTFLLLLKKKNENEVLIICVRREIFFFKI